MNNYPVRVLRVVSKMDRAGLETVIMNCYRVTDREKIQYDFVVHTKDCGAYDEEIRSLGGEIYYMPHYNIVNHSIYCKAWEDFFRTHPEYKIIHGHMRSTAAIYLRIAQKYGLVTIAHSHGVSSGKGLQAMVKNYMQRNIFVYSNYMLACSQEAGEWLFGKDVGEKANFKVLKNGIDVEKFKFNSADREKVREEYGFKNKIVIGHVGRYDDAKNQMFIVELVNKFKERAKGKFIVLMIGTAEGKEYYQRVNEKIRMYNLQDTIYALGARSDVSRLMQGMDIFVFPSKYEGFGNVVVEAQASGLPCIISDHVPNAVIVTDLVRQISLSDDFRLWWEEIEKMGNGGMRRERVQDIVEAGYDIRTLAKWYEEFYLNCTRKDYCFS